MPGPVQGRAAVMFFLPGLFFLLALCFLACVMTCLFQADCSFKPEPYLDGECQGLLMGHAEAIPS